MGLTARRTGQAVRAATALVERAVAPTALTQPVRTARSALSTTAATRAANRPARASIIGARVSNTVSAQAAARSAVA